MSAAAKVRPRSRLSRTMTQARWDEYKSLLLEATRAGYVLSTVEDWLDGSVPEGERHMALRHDVDQHPASALKMAAVESELGARSTWYFRWRTAHPAVVEALKEAGFSIGLHYETLSREALARGLRTEAEINEAVEPARVVLHREIVAFVARFGRIRSVAPHGDSRIPEARNALLLRDEDAPSYGIDFDANEALRGRRLGFWLTDRSAPEGRWVDGVRPISLLEQGVSPIMCLTHPNNWESGPRLWVDRALRSALPAPASLRRPIRTGPDGPPI